MHSWGGEEGGRERNFRVFFFFLGDRSVGHGEQIWGRSLEDPGTKNPFLLILGVEEGREFLLTLLFQVPPPLRHVGPRFLHCLGTFLER